MRPPRHAFGLVLSLTLVFTVGTTGARAAALSPLKTNPATGRQYCLLQQGNWTSSEQNAFQMGAHLATVRTQGEQDWIYNTFGAYGGVPRLLWIGINDAPREGKFGWVSGQTSTFTAWAAGEPNASSSGEDYVAMYYPGHSSQGQWNDWGNLLVDPAAVRFAGVAELTPGLTSVLVPAGATWRYYDLGADLGTSWRNLGYSDASWKSGPAQLGYGDDDEATVVGYGPNESSKYITTYFRYRFDVANRAAFRRLTLSVLRDDGVVVYLNGTEVFRDNIPVGTVSAGTLAVDSIAGEEETTDFVSAFIDPAFLQDGANVVAVEIHQADPTSSDISFDLQLLATGSVPPAVGLIDPCDGDPVGAPEGLTLRATATDDEGVANVAFYGNGQLLGIDATSPYSLALSNPPAGAATYLAVATDNRGLSSTSAPVRVTLLPQMVAAGALWRFLDTGVNLGTAWRMPGFDDSAWSQGRAQLGYGEGDEATAVGFGGNSNNRYITTYFRHAFTVPDPTRFTNLVLRLLRDDGAVVYLNGLEVWRSNMPAPDPITYTTLAASAVGGLDETKFFTAAISPTRLVSGLNVLAVEVHQAATNSTDLSFDLDLLGEQPSTAPRMTARPRGPNPELLWSAFDLGYEVRSSPSLNPPVTWTPVNGTLTRTNGYHRFVPATAGSQVFYRLMLRP